MSLRRFLTVYGIILSFLLTFSLGMPIVDLELNKSQFLGIMENLNQTVTRQELRAMFDRVYNYTELLTWVHEKLVYTKGNIHRYKD